MRTRRSTPVTNLSLSTDGIGFAFASGFSRNKCEAMPQIPREEWADENKRMQAEESDWWDGQLVSAQLAVELPFWLMISDGEVSLTYDKTTVIAVIQGRFMEVSDGPMSLTSKSNAVRIGTADELWGRELPRSSRASMSERGFG